MANAAGGMAMNLAIKAAKVMLLNAIEGTDRLKEQRYIKHNPGAINDENLYTNFLA